NIYNLPKIFTFSRLLAAPMVGYLILHNHHLYAVSLFLYAGLTDLLDGYLARRYSLQTVVGSVVDPMADKLLVTIVVVCLAANGTLPLWLATLMFGRDASLGLAAIYYPREFTRAEDFHAVLGFSAAERAGVSDDCVQVQHVPAALPYWRDDGVAVGRGAADLGCC
ncbi:hypothetical protein LTS18_006490, partial [Coniosporium uncinatum]